MAIFQDYTVLCVLCFIIVIARHGLVSHSLHRSFNTDKRMELLEPIVSFLEKEPVAVYYFKEGVASYERDKAAVAVNESGGLILSECDLDCR